MALHLVTGYKGTPHITADDVGAFNAGLLGEGEYVLSSGNKLAASLVSSNTVRVLDGDVVVQGRHISLKKGTYEEVTISNGTTGMNRNDLIVVRYTKDSSTGAENAVFAVIQGTETSGTATDPECTTGDILSGGCTLHEMPLYRIPLTGVTVGEPEALFEAVNSIGGTDGLVCRGINPITSSDNDTPFTWRDLGVGMWKFESPTNLQGGNMNFTEGTLLNIHDDDSRQFQLYLTPSGGIYYRRSLMDSNEWANSNYSKTSDTKHPWSSVSTLKVDTGYYSGAGKYGSGNENKLAFAFKPEFIVIMDGGYPALTWVSGMDWVGWLSPGGEQKSVSTDCQDNKFYWYSSNDAGEQLNKSGTKYRYFAIG